MHGFRVLAVDSENNMAGISGQLREASWGQVLEHLPSKTQRQLSGSVLYMCLFLEQSEAI